MKLRIKEFRQQKGLTQTSLARSSRCSREQINRYENEKAIPDIESLCRIRTALGCSLEDLVIDA